MRWPWPTGGVCCAKRKKKVFVIHGFHILEYSYVYLYNATQICKLFDSFKNYIIYIYIFSNNLYMYPYLFILSPCMLLHLILLPTLCTYLIKNYHNSHLKSHTLKMSVMHNQKLKPNMFRSHSSDHHQGSITVVVVLYGPYPNVS